VKGMARGGDRRGGEVRAMKRSSRKGVRAGSHHRWCRKNFSKASRTYYADVKKDTQKTGQTERSDEVLAKEKDLERERRAENREERKETKISA